MKKKRKKGGQPGNLNALKHGFYSRQFRKEEIADLEAIEAEGLKDEITMMRVMIRRLMEMADGVKDIEMFLSVVGAIGMACSRLASMLRTAAFIGRNSGVESEIRMALEELADELGLE